jgi:formylglycine-generating enzyme required for sulfatase activity
MKRILGIAMVLGLVGSLTVMAQEVKPGKAEVIELGKDVKLEMVLIPAGKFLMGGRKIPVDPLGNIKVAQPEEDEYPRHEVTLTKPYFMGKYEVTQEQWFEIMGENPSREKGRKLPVTDVSWEDCHQFIKKLNTKTNGGYRLPTEGEWEYACRAGTTTAYSVGDEITPNDANYGGGSKIREPVAVGSYKPNAFGLYDMHGNVWEWCEDWYGKYLFTETDPKGPATGKVRVLRGGSFGSIESNARSSFRLYLSPSDRRYDGFGFRLARTK